MTSFSRSALTDFDFGSAVYAGATVTAYTVDNFGNKTAFLATLFADLTTATALQNPQTLDGFGQWVQPVYIDNSVVLTISGAEGVPDHQTGVISANLAGSAATDAAAAAASASAMFGYVSDIYARVKSIYGKVKTQALPLSLVALNMLRIKADGSGYELRSPTQVRGDIGFGTSLTTPVTKEPTRTVLTSGSGTYTTPAGATRLNVRMVGGGGGGSGGGGTPGSGGNGGNSTFGTMAANGGNGGVASSASAVGGTATGGDVNIVGGSGTGANTGLSTGAGSPGAAGAFGGGGAGAGPSASGLAGAPNSGAGGGGGAVTVAVQGSGGGGAAGGYTEKLIVTPAASFSYAVGAGGAAGTAGTSGTVGGAGAAGIIVIDEFYN